MYRFSAAHRLHVPTLSDAANQTIYGRCNNPNGHGHTYTLEVTVDGPVDSLTGMIMDRGALDQTVQTVLDPLDHTHLDREIPAFHHHPSTAEHLIVYLWNALAPRFGRGLASLRLWETSKNVVAYSQP